MTEIDISRIRFLDIEASGLQRGSYPIEFAWSDINLATQEFLVRPHLSWGLENWSVASERIHGISRQQLEADGIPVEDAAARLNAALAGMVVVSDHPGPDTHWLTTLFELVEIEPEFEIGDWHELCQIEAAQQWLTQEEVTAIEVATSSEFPRLHRARPDALYLAAVFRALRAAG
jgi:hypothetical protein